MIIRPGRGTGPIKFILHEFVSYLGNKGCCVWETVNISVNQSLSMSNITFEVPRLSNFVLKKSSEKIHSRLNIVIKA